MVPRGIADTIRPHEAVGLAENWSMKKVLVLGAGRVGKSVAEMLLAWFQNLRKPSPGSIWQTLTTY